MSTVPAEQRLARILAIVPWIAAADGPSIAEVCSRFGLSEEELMADLDLLLFCGVYPFTPDTLIEVDVDDGRVWLRFADYFRRPLRLTPPEALALLAAGAALLAVPGASGEPEHAETTTGSLGRALAKLEDILGISRDESLDVTLGPAEPAVLDAVRRAAAESRKLAIDYYSFGRDGRTERVVQPWRVFHRDGRWYLEGWCERAEGERLFRVDRIVSAEVLGDQSPDPPSRTAEVYHPDSSDPLVVLDLAPAAGWVAERYPNEGVETRRDGRTRVRLRASERPWLERLLLTLGDDATLVEGDPQVRAGAARRVLARYRT
ncbi:MAG: WYL domain-containing protein [Acidimicrobiaceae bacterium]|nr:WYL domain-containing protein [Acidimicrobiaceae bacterium]